MCGCLGGHAWLLGGACVVAPVGHTWLLWGGMHGCSGGMHGCSRGGVCGCSGGHAWLLWGGMCGCSRGACVGYNEIRRYGQWAGGMHPTGMHSCFKCFFVIYVLRGWSAFDWKAFLFWYSFWQILSQIIGRVSPSRKYWIRHWLEHSKLYFTFFFVGWATDLVTAWWLFLFKHIFKAGFHLPFQAICASVQSSFPSSSLMVPGESRGISDQCYLLFFSNV